MTFTDSKLFSCGDEGGLVAGLVRWDRGANVITWVNPGGRQRAYDIKTFIERDDELDFMDSEGRRFVLRPLTPSLYNQRIRRLSDPHVMNEAELLAAFEKSLA